MYEREPQPSPRRRQFLGVREAPDRDLIWTLFRVLRSVAFNLKRRTV
ncbi:hypothetical protein FRAHR75_300035 [Frankia sp. Hr75.2]|nr:hypothetical protein FRAHR75_300035 [Frankia sp. Hr75.2]SQD98900.1 hypothetical protein FMEAI12_4980009 [Parafrankia sp. Ea1.12]